MFLARSKTIFASQIVGLGDMATQYSSFVNISGGFITGLSSPLPVASGGTGANTAAGARTNLGILRTAATPTLTNVTNVAASTASDFTSIRIGNDVIFFGRITIDVTTASVATELGISLAYASNFTLFTQCGGTVFSKDQFGLGAMMRADITNDRISLQYIAGVGTSNYEFYVMGGYNVV